MAGFYSFVIKKSIFLTISSVFGTRVYPMVKKMLTIIRSVIFQCLESSKDLPVFILKFEKILKRIKCSPSIDTKHDVIVPTTDEILALK